MMRRKELIPIWCVRPIRFFLMTAGRSFPESDSLQDGIAPAFNADFGATAPFPTSPPDASKISN